MPISLRALTRMCTKSSDSKSTRANCFKAFIKRPGKQNKLCSISREDRLKNFSPYLTLWQQLLELINFNITHIFH